MEVLRYFSGAEILWASLTGYYTVRGAIDVVSGATGDQDFDGKTSFLKYRKRPIRRLLLFTVTNGVIAAMVLGAYGLGKNPFNFVQNVIGRLMKPDNVNTDEFSAVLACLLLLGHGVQQLYHSVYVNFFSGATQSLPDFLSHHAYTLLAGVTILTEAPSLEDVTDPWFSFAVLKWRHIAGLGLFIVLAKLNHSISYSLVRMRQNRSGHIVSEQYKMPKGGVFGVVSCPHYLSEIMFHVGVGVILGTSHRAWWLCSGYVVARQVFAALKRRQWYRRKFEAFPSSQKAIIPYVL